MTVPDQNSGLSSYPDSDPKPKASLQDILKTKVKVVKETKEQEEAAKKAKEEVDRRADELEDFMTQTEEDEEKTDKLEGFMVDTDNKTEDIMTLTGQQKKLNQTKLTIEKSTESISESQAAYASSQEALKEIYNTGIADTDLAELFKQSEINSWEDLPKLDGFSESKEAIDSENLKKEVAKKIEEKKALEKKIRQDLGLAEDSEEISLETIIDQKVQELGAKIDELKPQTPEGFVEIIADVNTKMQTWFDERIRNTPGCDSSLEDSSWLNNLSKINLTLATPDLTEEAKQLGKTPQELQQAFLQKALHEFLDQNEAKRVSLTEEVDSVKRKTIAKDRLNVWVGDGASGRFSQKWGDTTNVNKEIIKVQYKAKTHQEAYVNMSDVRKEDFLGSGIGLWGYEKDSKSWTVPESGKIIQTKDGRYILEKVDTEAYRDYLEKVGQIDIAIRHITESSGNKYDDKYINRADFDNFDRLLPLNELFKIIGSDFSDEKSSVTASTFLKSIGISEEKIPKLVEDLKKASIALREISGVTKESMTGIEVSSDFAKIWEKCGGDMEKMKAYISENFKSGDNQELRSQLEKKTKAKLDFDTDNKKLSNLSDQDLLTGERKMASLGEILNSISEVSNKIIRKTQKNASLKMVDGKIIVSHPKINELNQAIQDQSDKKQEIEDKKNESDGFLGSNKKKKEQSLILLKQEEHQISKKIEESKDNLSDIGIYQLQRLVDSLDLTDDEKNRLLNNYQGASNRLANIVEDRLKNGTGLTAAEKDKIAQKKELVEKIAEEKRIFERQ